MSVAHFMVISCAALLLSVPTGVSAQTGGDKALGEYLSSECVACHQISGKTAGSIPSIIGLSETHISQALNDYRTKKRSHDVMSTIASRLSQDDINALAAFFASVKP